MNTVLKLKNINKYYPGVTALDNVSMEFKEAEVHALMGENGAGKSTLIKIVSGAIQPDGGSIELFGKDYSKENKWSPAAAKANGIGVIYQEFTLVPTMSVVENIFLGQRVGSALMPDFKEMHRRAAEIFEEFGVSIDTSAMVSALTPGKQQLVEIAKALTQNVKIMIMDEPSASISVADAETLFGIIKKLKKKGVSTIYISHRMEEIFRIADRVSVMRDGKYIDTRTAQDATRKELITMMVGRELNESFPERNVVLGEEVLKLNDVTGNGDYNVSFALRKGEILGLAGLVGAGRTELAKVVYGAAKLRSGDIFIRGEKVRINTPKDAIRLGVGYIPEDRKREGVFLEFPIDWNISIMCLPQNSSGIVIVQEKIHTQAKAFQDKLRIKTPSLSQYVKNLSGGNQQKVVVAKTLAAKTDIIIFDEPTRGIDVGAKQEIYALMNELVDQGISIIMISSEMEELIGMSDRIIVMHEGRIKGHLEKENFSQNKILELASGL